MNIYKLVLVIVVAYVLYKIYKSWTSVKGAKQGNLPARGEDLVEDPLCHAYVPVSNARRCEIDGKMLYFCSQKCLEAYKQGKKP